MSATPHPSLFADAWAELRRRKVVRAGATYAVTAWVVLQLGEITFEPLGLPPRALTWTILAAILGFPLVLVLAWFFDVGPGGVTRDRSPAAKAGAVFAVLTVLLTVIGVGSWLSQVYPADPVAEAPARAAAPQNSIAVLPFEDMSPARDQSHLSDGIAEELLDRLARNRGLRVAARTSSFALRDRAADIRQIGELLNVRWVLEGSVRKAGGRLRITAQLIDAENGYHQWSETYDRDDSDLFALQDDVSAAIAGQLQGLIQSAGPVDHAADSHSPNSQVPAAHEAFLRGRQLWRQRTPAGLREAEQLFSEATRLDPQNARAWSGLADTYLLQADYGGRATGEAVQLAEPAAVRAITLAPQSGEAWATLGLLRMTAGQLPAAERSLREAIRLDPRYEMAPTWLANVLRLRGDVDEQEQVLRQAQQLNPLEPVINSNLAALQVQRGDVAGAEALLQRVLAITPQDALLLRSLASLELSRGQLAKAREYARAALATDPTAPANIETAVQIDNALGDTAAAHALLDGLPAEAEFVLALRQWTLLYEPQPRALPALQQRVRSLSARDAGAHVALVMLAAWASVAEDRNDDAAALLRLLVGDDGDGAKHLEADSLLAALSAPLAPEQQLRWTEAAARVADRQGRSAEGAFLAAGLHALVGQADAALPLLSAAIDHGFRDSVRLRFDPRLASLRGDPRYAAQLERLNRLLDEQRALATRP